MKYSLENYNEEVVEKVFKDTKVKIVGPLSKVFAEVLNQAFKKTYGLIEENKKELGLENLHVDNTTPNLPGDVLPKLVTEIVNAPKNSQPLLFIKESDDVTEEDVVVMGSQANVKGNNFIFIIDETKNILDPNHKDNPDKILLTESLESIVLNNGGQVYKVAFM